MIEVKNPNNLKTAHIDSFKPLQGELKDLSQENYNKLKNSILKHGFNIPVFVWNGYLLDGHQRQRVLLQEGWNVEVPYVEIEAETELEAKEILLKITSQYGKITLEGLDDFYPEWQELDINFDAISILDTEEPQEVIEDEVPEPPLEPKTVLGDLYEIGEHRLLCGDSTDSDQVAKLMNGQKADMVFTDPPYGVNMNRSGKILNDNLTDDDLFNLINSAFVNSIIFSKDCHFYWWIGFKGYSIMEKCFIDNGIKIDNCIVWNKPSIGLGKTGYRYKHELCVFKGEIKDKSLSDVWDFGRDSQGLHPTMKPVELISYAFNNSSKSNDIILDLFGGSGSTMVTAQQLNRKARLMELDPKYCDVIVTRMLELDPALIIKRNGQIIDWDI
jgi:DNA modification methylase